MLIAVSFPQFFRKKNRKSCCTANQNIVNGRKKETAKTVHASIAAMTDSSKMTVLKAFLSMVFSIFSPAEEIEIDHTYPVFRGSTGNPCKA